MNGHGPIVLATKQENFHEHPDLDSAEREAHRLVVLVVTEHIRGNGRPESPNAPVIKLALPVGGIAP